MPTAWEVERDRKRARMGTLGPNVIPAMPRIVDPVELNELIESYELACIARDRAEGAIGDRIVELRAEYALAESPGVKAALTKAIAKLARAL